MAAIYHCAKCGAEHTITCAPDAPPVHVIKITCRCGNVLVVDDPTIEALPKFPDDVMAVARELVLSALDSVGDGTCDEFGPDIEKIARAIMAERERCAKIVEAFDETTVDGRAELAAAIRGGKP